MAISNLDRVGRAIELLTEGLKPFVERELSSEFGTYWVTQGTENWKNELKWLDDNQPHLDANALLRLIWEQWNTVFCKTLGRAERSVVSELRDARKAWAHQEPFSSDDAYRALDSASRLLLAVSAEQATEVDRMKMELLKQRFDDQVRNEKKKEIRATVESTVTGQLKPWREVVMPHADVATGDFGQAEFAADLWQVHIGEGTNEYADPAEFFRRTYVTESLGRLLADALKRITNNGGDPVVQLQTNFGGGKTHSMLALYHLFSGVGPKDLPGVEAVMQLAGVTKLPAAKRVVLVGNKISPGRPEVKADGIVVHTLWGELAYQLGGKEAYEKIREDDERATNPGDRLRELFNEYGPVLILIDEWVSYARQMHPEKDLPGGNFETHFSFAQALTEAAKLAKHCFLVISLPASDPSKEGAGAGEDIEVGGQRGKEALDRLRNVIGRVESSWRPATAEESFEIVRRRLFMPMTSADDFTQRDYVVRSFYDNYKAQAAEFPNECAEADYEKRMRMAYPIHPEVFDRLYSDWSTLASFQRTRGVLRLMAAVIHSLWIHNDRNPLIMPCHLPIDDSNVRFELTRYLPDNWTPVVEKDVDGAGSTPLRVDSETPNLGKYQASRRVARTIYLGSAPTHTAANKGIEDRRIKLGCVMPGESAQVFGDALRRLTGKATYLYEDSGRYWYSTQPTVTKVADDRAEDLRRNPDRIAAEIEKRVKAQLRTSGDFSRIHPFPSGTADIVDELDARLVVIESSRPHVRDNESAALAFAKDVLRNRGNAPRIYQNSLAFLAADKTKLEDLQDAVRLYLAWESIVSDKDHLDLTAQQVRQAENQKTKAHQMVESRVPEAFSWLLVPVQETPSSPVIWETHPLRGEGGLAPRASKKLRDKDLLFVTLAPTMLRNWLDKIPLWEGEKRDHVKVSQLMEFFGRYLYLPRLRSSSILTHSISDGLKLESWALDTFAYAEGYDVEADRFTALTSGKGRFFGAEIPSGVLVRADVAAAQFRSDQVTSAQMTGAAIPVLPPDDEVISTGGLFGGVPVGTVTPTPARATRYHGSVELHPERAGRDASRIADEVISHLVGLMRSKVKVTLEIEAEIPEGVPDDVRRIVTQNGRDLKFETGSGFEN